MSNVLTSILMCPHVHNLVSLCIDAPTYAMQHVSSCQKVCVLMVTKSALITSVVCPHVNNHMSLRSVMQDYIYEDTR